MLGVIALSSSFALEIPEADGSDGELTITSANCTNGVYTINLGRAATKAWNDRPVKPGCGVYDPDKWAVVFKYTSVRIDEGCTLKFVNHPSNPPVFWLVSGDVVINGLINLDGGHGQDTSDSSAMFCSQPGPGGFAGGLKVRGCGFGPGGGYTSGDYYGASASHATLGIKHTSYYGTDNYGIIYGDKTLIPLMGGSGGAANNVNDYAGGGAGGGAICIAAKGNVSLGVSGRISARGGRGGGDTTHAYSYNYGFTCFGGSGSGGAVRIIAEKFQGQGYIDVTGYSGSAAEVANDLKVGIAWVDESVKGGNGYIRLDATFQNNPNDFNHWTVKPSIGSTDNIILWADAKITPLTIGGVSLPTDPHYREDGRNECLSFTTTGERELVFRTENIPTEAQVVVKVTPLQCDSSFTTQNIVAVMDEGGTYASATWRAMIPLRIARTTFQILVSTTPLYE